MLAIVRPLLSRGNPGRSPLGRRLASLLVFAALVLFSSASFSSELSAAAKPSYAAKPVPASSLVEGDGHQAEGAEGHADEAHGPVTFKSASDIFIYKFKHLLPHPYPGMDLELGRVSVPFSNTQVWQLLAIGLMLLLFLFVGFSLRGYLDREKKLGWVARVFSGWCLFIRDEMVMPLLGEEKGKALLPYFLFLFFFIAFMNVLGLVPGSATATASIFVTGALALTTFALMVGGGMMEQGPGAFWKSLIPHGLPGFLVPLMFVIEIVGLLVKPFALMIRLFANLTGGHLVVYSFMGLIFYFAIIKDAGDASWVIATPWVGLAVFIMIIESFVALLQAYIFTYLSILFVGMCLHPEH
ncbi:MAG: ATP synthase F0 subunit A [Planctomycetota bacterium]|nr:MAG: ATP synthase F0 subunit A [Planctomycetota bacterium]